MELCNLGSPSRPVGRTEPRDSRLAPSIKTTCEADGRVGREGCMAGYAYLIKDHQGTFSKNRSRKANELALALA